MYTCILFEADEADYAKNYASHDIVSMNHLPSELQVYSPIVVSLFLTFVVYL